MRPRVDNLIVAFVVGDETHVIVVGNLLNFSISLLHEFSLLVRNDDIIEVEGKTCQISHAITEVLDTIKELTGLSKAHFINNIGNDITE